MIEGRPLNPAAPDARAVRGDEQRNVGRTRRIGLRRRGNE
jgi:hypothetical protein